MKFRLLQLGLAFSLITLSACAPTIKPTDSCKIDIPVTEFSSNNNFDYIDFFDFSVDVAKENNFQPPMLYDKEKGLIVFGNEEILEMPGLKMVVYMWVDNPQSVDEICINSQLLDTRAGTVTEGMANESLLNFKEELISGYNQRIDDMERIYKKYQ